jgi:repressor LexA
LLSLRAVVAKEGTQAEIVEHFGYGSRNAVAQHLRLIWQKGQLGETNGKARSIRVLSPLQRFKQRIVDIPVFGSIPAGYGEDRVQEAEGCVSVDVESIGIKPTRNTFA